MALFLCPSPCSPPRAELWTFHSGDPGGASTGRRELSPCCSSLPHWPPPRQSATRRTALENCRRQQCCGKWLRALEPAKGDESSQCHISRRGLCHPGRLAKGLRREEEGMRGCLLIQMRPSARPGSSRALCSSGFSRLVLPHPQSGLLVQASYPLLFRGPLNGI